MNRTALAKSGKFYTYGHYLDGKLIYIGEGSLHRGWRFHDKSYKDRREEVEVRIFGIFDNKQIAVFNEGLLIYQERMNGNTHLLNKADYGQGLAGLSADRTGEKNPAHGRTGEKHPVFKGLSVGTNRTSGKTIVFDGKNSMKARGFNQSSISKCILHGKEHQNFTFIRTTDEDYLRQLLAADNFHDEESKLILQQFLG
jgi:hypothetical protein